MLKTLPDMPHDAAEFKLRQRIAAAQFVNAFGDVAAGVGERAVQIEDDELKAAGWDLQRSISSIS